MMLRAAAPHIRREFNAADIRAIFLATHLARRVRILWMLAQTYVTTTEVFFAAL